MGISLALQKELYMSRAKQPPNLDNETITISSTDSSPKSGLANPSIDLALNDERAVLLNVNNVHLHIATLDVHDGKGLLPISRSLGI